MRPLCPHLVSAKGSFIESVFVLELIILNGNRIMFGVKASKAPVIFFIQLRFSHRWCE